MTVGMNQVTLTTFSAPDHIREVTKKIPVYDCRNCNLFRGFVAGPKVACMGHLREIPAKGCSCWSDGEELEIMASFAPPAGWQAKKWTGGRA